MMTGAHQGRSSTVSLSDIGGGTSAPPGAGGGGGDAEQKHVVATTATSSTAGRKTGGGLATPKLQFFKRDILACINCATEVTEPKPAQQQHQLSTDTASATATAATTAVGGVNKLGPLLMELRQIVYDPDLDNASHFFRTVSIGQARGNPNFGSSVASTCLSVHPDPNVNVCATGQSTGSLCIHALASLTLSSSSSGSSSDHGDSGAIAWQCAAPDYYQNGQRMSHRAASAVEWRPHLSSHIAVGLTAGGGGGGHTDNSATTMRQPMRLASGHGSGGNGGGGTSSGDRDHNCFVWDVEHQRGQRAAPLYRVAHQTGVSSLGWALDGQVLILGNQHRNLQLYDLRIDSGSSNASRAPLSVHAHNFGVHGIQVDPAKPFQFVSFSRAMGEPVKLWDARRMTTTPVMEIKLGASATVQMAEWLHNGKLTLLVGSTLHCYDTSTGARPIFSRSFHLENAGVNDFATYPYDGDDGRKQDIVTTYLKKRVFVTRLDKTISDAPFHRSAPLSVSKHSGQLISAFASDINFTWPLPAATVRGPDATTIRSDEDISDTMMRRAQGKGKERYSLKVATNCRFLLDEAHNADGGTERQQKARKELYNAWRWVHWIEGLLEETTDKARMLLKSTLQFRGLLDAGVMKLLDLDNNGQDLQGISKTLSVATFDSKGRRYVQLLYSTATVF
jgi:hypothetical protein